MLTCPSTFKQLVRDYSERVTLHAVLCRIASIQNLLFANTYHPTRGSISGQAPSALSVSLRGCAVSR